MKWTATVLQAMKWLQGTTMAHVGDYGMTIRNNHGTRWWLCNWLIISDCECEHQCLTLICSKRKWCKLNPVLHQQKNLMMLQEITWQCRPYWYLQSKVMRAESSGTSHQTIQPPPVPTSLESFAPSEHQDPSQCQTPRSTLSAGSMTTRQNGAQDPSQCQTPRSTLKCWKYDNLSEWCTGP